ncbi:MAG: SDR family oxidoreductase [Acidimicrobiia bacterium]|nr:SDR family oxidoreductase [Acidimicrobiia bacterium]
MMLGRVLVTGGASGIGAETCRVLAAAGWEPIPADVVVGDGLTPLDVADEAAWDRVLDATGVLAGLVNCAGVRGRSDIVDTSAAEFERHLRINVTGTWLGIRGFLRRHLQGAAAAIVNIASVNAEIAVAGQAHYVASKGAVAALTRAAAIEAAPLGVRVNAVAPGGIRTPMTAERLVDPAQVAWFGERVPLGRVGEPGEVAEVVEFLLSERASYITGEVLFADGGWHAHA